MPGSQELNPYLTSGRQGPNNLSHPLLYLEVGISRKLQSELEPGLKTNQFYMDERVPSSAWRRFCVKCLPGSDLLVFVLDLKKLDSNISFICILAFHFQIAQNAMMKYHLVGGLYVRYLFSCSFLRLGSLKSRWNVTWFLDEGSVSDLPIATFPRVLTWWQKRKREKSLVQLLIKTIISWWEFYPHDLL